jgi:hypothetical protein
MTRKAGHSPNMGPHAGEIGDLDAAAKARREGELRLSMSERLARVHSLSKQMSAVKNSARPR